MNYINNLKLSVYCCVLCSVMSDSFATPRTGAHQAPLFTRFYKQEYWSGQPFPSPGDLPKPGIEPRSSALQGYSLPAEPQGSLCNEASIKKKKTKIQSWESFWVDEYIQVLGGWHTPTIGRQMLVYSELSCTLLYISSSGYLSISLIISFIINQLT